MVREDDLVEFMLAFDGVEERNNEEQEKLRVFYRGDVIMAVVEKGTSPLRIETRCDRKLGKTLQERYESVMQSRWLGRNGIEIVCSGQLEEDDVKDLVRHAYEISVEE